MPSPIRHPHGTDERWRHGCRCRHCTAAHGESVAVRGPHQPHREVLNIDPDVVRMLIMAMDVPVAVFGRQVLGPHGGDYLKAALKRGRMEVYRLDKLAVALGTHMASLAPGYTEASERWAQEGAVA